MTDGSNKVDDSYLEGIRVLEIADELGEFCGRVLSGLGADVLKVEPPTGEITRTYGPFLDDIPGPNRSLHFWHYNLGKRSATLDLDDEADRGIFRDLASAADVVLVSRSPAYMRERGLDEGALRALNPSLVYARISPFGDDGPWSTYRGSDLVHLALGGVAMNCGYDPDLRGRYDTPPIAPQMWQSYQIAGELMTLAVMAALYYRHRGGQGQYLTVSVHDAVSKCTESDIPNWIYSSLEHFRQTCRHSMPTLTREMICRTKDGRWQLPYSTYMTSAMKNDVPSTASLLSKYGMQADLDDERYLDPGYLRHPGVAAHVSHVVSDFFLRVLASEETWKEAQAVGLPWSPIRRPEENLQDEHWRMRDTFEEIRHPEIGRSFTDVTSKWVSDVPWRKGQRVPMLGADSAEWVESAPKRSTPYEATIASTEPKSWRGSPSALHGVRIVDLSWILASGGAGRFFAAMGAEVIKVEHHSRPDHMRGSPIGRVKRPPITDHGGVPQPLDMNGSGAFMEVNAGKLSVSLDLKNAEGLRLLKTLIRDADALISGFAPGALDRLGLGYDVVRAINPRIVMVEQSGMGAVGTYGSTRSYGPTAQAMSGLTEMSGLPEPYPPAGIGYSYLDWFGAYNMANSVMSGLYRAAVTGLGCHIDSSQVEVGLSLAGTAFLDYSANGRRWMRYGNRSPYKAAAPSGIYRATGEDSWIAISCFSDNDWDILVRVLGLTSLSTDARFESLSERLRNQDALDAVIDEATGGWDAYALMGELQAAGVAAGVCQTARDRIERDPQLAFGEWLVELNQTELGTFPVRELPFSMSATPPAIGGRLRRSGPNYGEDNDYVLGTILGLSEAEVAELKLSGVVGS